MSVLNVSTPADFSLSLRFSHQSKTLWFVWFLHQQSWEMAQSVCWTECNCCKGQSVELRKISNTTRVFLTSCWTAGSVWWPRNSGSSSRSSSLCRPPQSCSPGPSAGLEHEHTHTAQLQPILSANPFKVHCYIGPQVYTHTLTFNEGVSFDVLRQTQHRPLVVSTGNLNITDQSHDQSQLDGCSSC